MAKGAGGTRGRSITLASEPVSEFLSTGIEDKPSNREEFNTMMKTGKYVENESFIDNETGAYVAVMKGHNIDDNERFVAKSFARYGVNVVLTPEGDMYASYATNIKRGKHGQVIYKFSEGKIDIYTYEQKTATKEEVSDKKANIIQAIRHANTKKAQVAVLYDKDNLFKDEDIMNGIGEYKEHNRNWAVKAIALIVVDKNGNVLEYKF